VTRPDAATLPAQYRRGLSREEINALPICRYEGEVCLVASPRDLERAAAALLQERVVGFDTETRPAFRVGERYPPALVQAAGSQCVYLFALRMREVHPFIAALLASETTHKAGVGLADDVNGLETLMAFEARALVDLGALARRHGLAKSSVRALAALFLGVRIPKGSKTSNWAAPRLNPRQIGYAATDAWVCRELHLRFSALGLIDPAAPATG
jgi:ribonuclease D